MTLTRLLQSAPLEAVIKGSLPAEVGDWGGSRQRTVSGDDSLQGRANTPKGKVESGHSQERLREEVEFEWQAETRCSHGFSSWTSPMWRLPTSW